MKRTFTYIWREEEGKRAYHGTGAAGYWLNVAAPVEAVIRRAGISDDTIVVGSAICRAALLPVYNKSRFTSVHAHM